MTQTGNFYKDTVKDVEKRFDKSGYLKDDNRPLPVRRSKKVTGMIKDEIGRKSMTEIVALRANMHDHRKLDKSKKIRAARVQKNV